MRKFIKAFIFLPVAALFFFILSATTVFASPISVTLNTDYSVFLGQGASQEFTFTGNVGYYYVADTKGIGTTTLMLTCGNLTITDNYDGSHGKAQIKFEGTGSTMHIYLSYYIPYQQGTVTFQVRRMQAVLCGFDYGIGNINTEPDLIIPYNYIEGYEKYMYTDEILHDSDFFLQNVTNRWYPWLDSDLFFFSGHGNITEITFPNSCIDCGSNSFPYFHTNGIAVIAACHCAFDSPIGCFVDSLKDRGYKTVLGWETSIDSTDSKKFTDNLFIRLWQGYSLSDACLYVDSLNIYTYISIHSYRIAGNGNNTLFLGNDAMYRSSLNDDLLAQFNRDRSSDFSWNVVDMSKDWYDEGEHLYRYYKTINGYNTDDYYDVKYKDGVITHIFKGPGNIDGKTALPVLYNGYEYDSDDSRIVEVKIEIVYNTVNDMLVPVEANFIERTEGKYSYMESVYINLNTGTIFE